MRHRKLPSDCGGKVWYGMVWHDMFLYGAEGVPLKIQVTVCWIEHMYIAWFRIYLAFNIRR